LEGVPLPATRSELIEYARQADPSIAGDLAGLPDLEFGDLDTVGELLTLVPTAAVPPAHGLPRPESGKPPGGEDYLKPHPDDTGLVRHDAPRDRPPQEAIEQASQTQKRQQAEQGQG
jgi:hypothetical protein